jgi:hypothetical protein
MRTARHLTMAGLLGTLAAAAAAAPMVSGLGGPAGYGVQVMTPNDDGSSSQLNLPFTLNFYGNTFDKFYANNNGNISFNGPIGEYTPSPFPIARQPMIAPYWGDVDTRCSNCGTVYSASPNAQTLVVTWDGVGYYPSNSSKTNTFQLVLTDRSAGNTPGDFDIQFRYGQLQWTTGGASGGVNGLGGTPAQAGLDAGNSRDYFTLPGSRTAAVLDLINTSNTGEAGVWSFAVRNGVPPGATSDNPLMPVVTDAGWSFDFNVGPNSGRVFIDPVIAVGYEYAVTSGPNFQSVLLPTTVGDGLYDLWLYVNNQWVDSGDVTGGQAYDFGAGGVNRFQIRGIETSAGLDPNNPNAFVTGLTFVPVSGSTNVQMTMTPLTVNTDNQVPVPGTLPLVLLGLLAAARVKRRGARDQATTA